MSDTELAEKIKLLPTEQKRQVEKMIEEILLSQKSPASVFSSSPGFAKGLIEMLPGFDDPIEGMEEYM